MKEQTDRDNEMKNQIKEQKDKKSNALGEEDSSEWSLESLEDIKAINIHQLEEEQQNLQSTHNKQKQLLQVKFPEKPNVVSNSPLHEVGKVIFVVGELLIVEALSAAFVVDLDNWIVDEQRNLIGFVIDVLGRIENPYYAIKPQITAQLNLFLGKSIFYIEGSSKILKDDDIKSMQSKSALQAEQQNDSSEDDELLQKIQCKSEVQRPQRRRSPPWRRQRRFMQEGDGRQDSRQRTRQNKANNRNQSRSRNDQNQKYLQGMYRQHYDQMMRLCNGSFQQNQNSPYVSQPFSQAPTLPSPSIAQFGSAHVAQPQFYGQTFQGQLFNNNQQMNVQGIESQQSFNGQRQVHNQSPFNNQPLFGGQTGSQPLFNNQQQINGLGLFGNSQQIFNGHLVPGQGGYMSNNGMFGGHGNQK